MKGRPRSIERKTAEHLTAIFATLSLSPVERIPVLGRTGPDISLNELQLVIDVKSRLEVPIGYTNQIAVIQRYGGDLLGVRLDNFPLLFTEEPEVYSTISSVLVNRYYSHMDEWTQSDCPSGYTALVLHRPKMSVGNALFIISQANRRRLQIWYSKRQQLQ